jgi:hypothetical protein
MGARQVLSHIWCDSGLHAAVLSVVPLPLLLLLVGGWQLRASWLRNVGAWFALLMQVWLQALAQHVMLHPWAGAVLEWHIAARCRSSCLLGAHAHTRHLCTSTMVLCSCSLSFSPDLGYMCVSCVVCDGAALPGPQPAQQLQLQLCWHCACAAGCWCCGCRPAGWLAGWLLCCSMGALVLMLVA